MSERQETGRSVARLSAASLGKQKMKVAAYCRVSTGREGQLTSIESQRSHYEQMISVHDDWELADIYYEEGLSGTRKESRPELNRMLRDCEKGKIDLILTKSISRLARNTSDCLEIVRTLSAMDVDIYFEKENIHTGMMGSEFLLTVLSSLAEEESHSISGNEQWSIRNRFEKGTFRYSIAPYGYRLADGSFVVEPEEAEVVRAIFGMVLEGKGTTLIAKELTEAGILRSGKDPGRKWHPSSIRSMVGNVVYMGDVLMQKTYHDENFRRHVNRGERKQYYINSHHEAIISREVFQQAQQAIRQRAKEKGIPEDGRTGNTYCFTGRLVCGSCGRPLKRITQKTKDGPVYHWGCTGHLEDVSSCPLKRIREKNIQAAFCTMIGKLHYAEDIILDRYFSALAQKRPEENRKLVAECEQKLTENIRTRQRILEMKTAGFMDATEAWKQMVHLESEAVLLREKLNELTMDDPEEEEARRLRMFVHEWGPDSWLMKRPGFADFPSEAFSEFVEKAVVSSRTEITFHLKCGLILKEEMRRR